MSISTRKRELAEVYKQGLLNDVLPFWISHCVDQEYGGFTMALNQDGSLLDDDKGVWQQGRFTWLLGELYNNLEQRQEWLELARHGIDFLDAHCFDPADGRMWFHVTREGKPIRKRRYAFTESFAAMAYGEYAKATGSSEYAEKAAACFQRFVDHSTNPQGVQPKFTDVRPVRGIGFPMIAVNTAQQLRESIQLQCAEEWIDRGIADIRKYHVKPEIECVVEQVSPSGELIDHFDGRMLNPGHAIEAAWFIMDEGRQRGDRELIELGCDMLKWMFRRGWDEQYGGLLYFVDIRGLPVQEYWHDMKFWWPHNEAIISTLMAWKLTGDDHFAALHQQVHDWSYQHFPDPEHGEWFGYLRRDGSVSTQLKGNLWKGPFHLPRMQWMCWKMLEEEC